jgi:hypothetical protein
VAREELQRHQGRFRPEDRAAAESLAHGIVQKLLHRPTTQLRNAAAGDLEAAARLEAVRDLFGIDGAPAPAPDGLPGRNGPSPDTEGEDDADRNAR